MAEIKTTRLSRQWLFKTGAFTVVLLGFGIWALLDASVFYARRGMADASYQLRAWLDAAANGSRLTTPNFTVPDPAATLKELESKEAELRSQATADGAAGRTAAADVAKLDWLRSLGRVWQLNNQPKRLGTNTDKKTIYFDPATGGGSLRSGSDQTAITLDALRQELQKHWASRSPPTPLSNYDLPVQWIFTVIGFAGGLWLVFTLVRAKVTASRITWEADAQRLSLPGGAGFTPADLAEIDKRLWHKYYVTLILRDGSRHKLDLLRFTPLEEWVLAMEKTAFPEAAKDAETAAEPAPAGNAEA